jgi:enoyl-CoA hydratase
VSKRVTYELSDEIATITMDDGKANALSIDMLTELDAAFDRAEADRAVVVLAGRDGRFSGGFDLAVMNAGTGRRGMVRAGFDLAARMLAFPTPVVIACTGHAIAMGVFLLLSADYRVGAEGPFKITANEVAIGITVPRSAIAVSRPRLAPTHFERALTLAEVYSPADAMNAGFLDRVVQSDEVHSIARDVATAFTQLDLDAYTATKALTRADTLSALHAAIDADYGPRR